MNHPMALDGRKSGDECHSVPSRLTSTSPRSAAPQLFMESRSRSLSPLKKKPKQPLHIRMNLTEMQVDKITDAFTSRVTPSPTKSHGRGVSSHSKSAARQTPSPTKPRVRYSLDSNDNKGQLRESVTFSQLMPQHAGESHSQTLASRRQRTTPAPIQVAGELKTVPHRPNMEPVPNEVSPLSPMDIAEFMEFQRCGSSMYTDDYCVSGKPEPLNLRPYRADEGVPQFVQHETGVARDTMIERPLKSPSRLRRLQATPSHRPSQAQGKGEEALMHIGGSPLKVAFRRESKKTSRVDSPLFSPFPFYFRGQDFPAQKRGEKILIGEKGWLERTEKLEKEAKSGSKKLGILDGIKKIARDVTEMHQGRRSQQVSTKLTGTQVSISLDAREQSLLYGELEFHLANALNSFITIQLEKGRLMTDKLKKIGDAWIQQGRPRVVGFRYDMETQLELIQAHIDDFVFLGRRQGNPVEIAGLLYAMRMNARAMRVRTFCQPDSVIAKQLVDSQSLFNMIGVGRDEDHALAEIAQFFKVCVERETNSHQKELSRARKSRVEHRKRREETVEEEDVFIPTRPLGCQDSAADDEWLYYQA